MDRLRVYIVDDQEIVRSGLRRLLELQPDFHVVGEAGDGEAALRELASTAPDIVIMDIRMPGMDGIELTRRVVEQLPGTRVVILSIYGHDYVAAAVEAGAQAFLLKDVSGQELLRALRSVAQGSATIHLSMPTEELAGFAVDGDHPASDQLSQRQRQVLDLLVGGATNAQIASTLFLSQRTVKRELTDIFRKVGVSRRGEAMAWATERRWH